MRVLNSIILLFLVSCKFPANSETITLDLSNQNLTTIPDSVFSLGKLEYLNLGNSFTLYPPLSALHQEGPSGQRMNQIRQIPEDISRLKRLKTLNLRANDLRSLPVSLVELRNLDTLDISFNIHFTVSKEFSTLKKMTWLQHLNIVATTIDTADIDILRKLLPRTKIDASFDEIVEEAIE